MSDHIGFVSIAPLPKEIRNDRFFLTDEETCQIQPGEWFGRAALVVYARHFHEQTAHRAATVRVLDGSRPETFKMTLDTSSGNNVLEFDFARMSPP